MSGIKGEEYKREVSEEIKKEYLFCPQAHCELEEKTALILFVISILLGGLGLLISVFIDKKGFNLQALLLILVLSVI